MTSLSPTANLKEINAHKKQINWGDVSALYHMISSSLGDLDGILTHGFDSAYKQLLNPNNWNGNIFKTTKSNDGKIKVLNKPKILLRHEFNDMGYELHCYPVINEEPITHRMINKPDCPFNEWIPEKMQMLFRVNSLVAFSIFCFQSGDEADIALLKFSHNKVTELIDTLSEFFQITEVKGYNISEFYQELAKRNGNIISQAF